MARMLLPLLLVAGAYLIGSIPFSFLVGYLAGRSDIRKIGSGNVGATNVLRSFGKLPGFVALLLDIFKGFAVITFARGLVGRPDWPFPALPGVGGGNPGSLPPSFWIGLAALLAVVGHMFPVWLGFHGGKGVATATGVFLAINPSAMAAAAIIFAIVVLTTRYVSLSSIAGAAAVPPLMRFMVHETFWIVTFSIIISTLIIARHYQNIARLAAGTERKVGERKDSL